MNKVKDDKKPDSPKMANVPFVKIFKFNPAEKPEEEFEKEVNEWTKKSTFKGQNPMPGKAFANHKTGEVYVVFIYMMRLEVPKNIIDN